MIPTADKSQTSHSPTTIESPSDSTNDPAKKSTWSNRSLKAASLSLGGLAVASFLDRYSSCSFAKSLLLYSLSQVPALLYILAKAEVDASLERQLHETLESNIINNARIPKGRSTCAGKCLAWINTPKDGVLADNLGYALKKNIH